MDRGQIGVLPRPSRLADESYLEFVTSFRNLAIRQLFPLVAQHGETALASAITAGSIAAPAPGKPVPLAAIRRQFRTVAVVPTFERFVRTQQEMMWRRTRESFLQTAPGLLARMDAAAASHPERLHIDPDFHVPAYTRCEIHCQPGGYTDDPLGGIVFHYGTKVFYEGSNDQDELHIELADRMTLPADGRVARILDIGCSIGQATTALRDNHPDADIWGLDVAEPLIRYAHMRAVEQGKTVHFKQALAEATGFGDGAFDCVLSYILFHEVTVPAMQAIIAEMFRVLRPGGTFSIYEFPNNDQDQLPASNRFLIDYDSRNNCEPYSPAFVASDFRGMLSAAGFVVEDGPALSNAFLQSLVARKPA